MPSQTNTLWSSECETAVNNQINLEYYASYCYHYLFTYFDRNNVGLKNIAKFFDKCSHEERDHAHKLIEYQNKRGGSVQLKSINNPDIDLSNFNRENDILLALRIAYELEVKVYNSLLELHRIGDNSGDPQFTDFIEGEYLEEQVDAMSELQVLISQVERIGTDGHGLWNFDREFKLN